MNDIFLDKIPENCKNTQENNFPLKDEATILEIINNNKIYKIKIDDCYNEIKDNKCDFIIYKQNDKIAFIELKSIANEEKYNHAIIQLKNTESHFKEDISQLDKKFIIAAKKFRKGKGFKYRKNKMGDIIEIKTKNEKFDFNNFTKISYR
ncbi:hypothetical protein N9X24_01495 [Rickettsiales bacterium]|nr:hypothetical protein [Rickettsiales bacterium]